MTRHNKGKFSTMKRNRQDNEDYYSPDNYQKNIQRNDTYIEGIKSTVEKYAGKFNIPIDNYLIQFVRIFEATMRYSDEIFNTNVDENMKMNIFRIIYNTESTRDEFDYIQSLLKDEYKNLFNVYDDEIYKYTNGSYCLYLIDFFVIVGKYIEINKFIKSDKFKKYVNMMGDHFKVQVDEKLLSNIETFFTKYLECPFGEKPKNINNVFGGGCFIIIIDLFEVFSYAKYPIDAFGIRIFNNNGSGYVFTDDYNFPPDHKKTIEYSDIDLCLRTGLKKSELMVCIQIMQIMRGLGEFGKNINNFDCAGPIIAEFAGIIMKYFDKMLVENANLQKRLAAANAEVAKLRGVTKKYDEFVNEVHSNMELSGKKSDFEEFKAYIMSIGENTYNNKVEKYYEKYYDEKSDEIDLGDDFVSKNSEKIRYKNINDENFHKLKKRIENVIGEGLVQWKKDQKTTTGSKMEDILKKLKKQ